VVHVDVCVLRSTQLMKQGQPARQALKDAETHNVTGQHIAVPVDRQAAEPVAVRIDDAPGVGLLIELEPVATQRHGPPQRLFEVFLADVLAGMAHDAHRDFRARIVESGAGMLSVAVVDGDQITRLGVGGHPVQHPGENVRLERDKLELHPGFRPGGAVRGRKRRLHGFE